MRNQGGFSIIESVISISLFALFFVGATTLYANWQQGERDRERSEAVATTAVLFLKDAHALINKDKIYTSNGATLRSDLLTAASMEYINGVATDSRVEDFQMKWAPRIERKIGNYVDSLEIVATTTDIRLYINGATTTKYIMEF